MENRRIAGILELIEKQQISREIERYRDEIEGFRWWHSEEAKCRIVANVRSLNRLGVSKIDLSFCSLENARLENANLEDSDLGGTNLRNANLNKANLRYAWLGKSVLSDATMAGADLCEADLFQADLRNSDLRDANLEGAMLNEADLTGAKFLTADQLLKAKNLYKAKMDSELLARIEKENPNLLVDPDSMKEEEENPEEARLDEGGRIRIPKKSREWMGKFGKEVFVTTLDGKSLVIYPLPLWDIRSKELSRKRKSEPVRRFLMMANRWGQRIETDSRGRIRIGKELLEKTGLKGRLRIEEKEDHIWLKNAD